MIALHCTYLRAEKNEDIVFFWGEKPPSSDKKQKVRLRKTDGFNVHPFLAGTEELEGTIKALDPYRSALYPLTIMQAYSILPSAGGLPLLSSGMSTGGSDTGDVGHMVEKLDMWAIKGIGIRSEDALLLLSSLSESQKTAGEYMIGADVHYWSKASKFVLELLIRQNFIPDMAESKDGKAYVTWRYVLSDDKDKERHALLARSMPPASGLSAHVSSSTRRRKAATQADGI